MAAPNFIINRLEEWNQHITADILQRIQGQLCLAKCEEIYVAASRRIGKTPEWDFGKDRALCAL
eukprot:15330887-Ditylum_brightwellii.AAC.1